MDRKKMSLHSRAALDAADTVRRVIDGMSGPAFMSEEVSEATSRRRDRLVGAAPDVLAAMQNGLPAYMADRLVRLDDGS